MSRVTKRKHVMREMRADNFEHPGKNQQIAKVMGSKGNNLHEVQPAADTAPFLASMPKKFRNNIWIKRGNFVIIEAIEEGSKVKAEIVKILTPQCTKEFIKDGIWPEKFMNIKTNAYIRVNTDDNTDNTDANTDNTDDKTDDKTDDNSDDNTDDEGLFKNTNRVPIEYESSDSDDTDKESDDDSD